MQRKSTNLFDLDLSGYTYTLINMLSFSDTKSSVGIGNWLSVFPQGVSFCCASPLFCESLLVL